MPMTIPERRIFRAERWAKAIDLLGGECVKCSSIKDLHFDHINNDREDRKHLVSYLLNRKWDLLVEELKKCQLLCSSCHAHKTNQEMGSRYKAIHGSATMYCRHKCRCDVCRESWRLYCIDIRAKLRYQNG